MPTAAGIIFSSLNNNTLSRLTGDRTVAAIPFACRYRLVDFCLSNLVNANISNISIVANYNYRSLLEHIGSGKDWDLARRARGVNFVSPFQNARNLTEARMFSTHMEALKSMSAYINDMREEFVVMMDSDTVLNIDLAEVIRRHDKSGADVTIVTKKAERDYTAKNPRMMLCSVGGRVTDIAMSSAYDERRPEMSVGIFVMRTLYLRRLIEEAVAYNNNSFTEFLLKNCKTQSYKSYRFSGYVATVSSFLDYYRCSMEIVKSEKARDTLIGKREAPILTRVHNSSPTVYKDGAKVEGSMLADECIIEGTVINSMLFRGVKVEKGAVVKNCVLFRGTHVSRGAEINCIVTDKDVYISENVTLSGNHNMPFYVQKSRKI